MSYLGRTDLEPAANPAEPKTTSASSFDWMYNAIVAPFAKPATSPAPPTPPPPPGSSVDILKWVAIGAVAYFLLKRKR